jgi:putative transposase
MRDHLRAELAAAALLMAAQWQRPGKGLITHSDRGSQYAASSYRELLEAWGMRQSMGRKGCCYDHAPSALGRSHGVMSAQLTGESFFHTLKVELVHRGRFATQTQEEARCLLFAYLEGYHNRQRLHSALGYRTPEQAERLAA